jgi:hypothetical protein
MKKELMTLFIFIGICFIGFLIFRNLNVQEGMRSDASGNSHTKPSNTSSSSPSSSSSSHSSSSSAANGIAGNAATYGANIKSQTVKLSDILLVSKYRSDYENAILNVDDLISNLMLKATLSLDQSNPSDGLKKIVELNMAKAALDKVMKFVDSSS